MVQLTQIARRLAFSSKRKMLYPRHSNSSDFREGKGVCVKSDVLVF